MNAEPVVDMHCHLGFAPDDAALDIAQQAAKEGARLLCCTVDVAEYTRMFALLSNCANVVVGVGMHPWWVANNSDAPESLFEAISQTRFVAEVGLDFGSRHISTAQQQLNTFERICLQCAQEGNKVLSIHSVHASSQVLDILESTGLTQTCSCIFHWFSGSSEELQRAIRMGCFFSVGVRMLATKRGKEYARIIPDEQLLFETDMPQQNEACTWQDMRECLRNAVGSLELIRNQKIIHDRFRASSILLG